MTLDESLRDKAIEFQNDSFRQRIIKAINHIYAIIPVAFPTPEQIPKRHAELISHYENLLNDYQKQRYPELTSRAPLPKES